MFELESGGAGGYRRRWFLGNGKEAGVIGLFDERIALVAAQSPGSGLASGWRPAEAEKSAGANVQTAAQIYGEENWMGDVPRALEAYARLTTANHIALSVTREGKPMTIDVHID
ncbi:hypothetical protein ACMHYB_07230 [Sorangium sp. So ce1128]